MGLIDADKLKDAECKMCRFCLTDSKGIKDIEGCREMGCGVMQLVDSQPTIEAVPIEQVARIITRITNKMPCDIADEMCPREDGTCGESACWEYAIKEGWLGE